MSSSVAAVTLLLLCGVVWTTHAQMDPVGPTTVYHIANVNVTGPRCVSTSSSGGFLDGGEFGSSSLGLLPFRNATSRPSIYQEIVEMRGAAYVFQLYIIGYNGLRREYFCNIRPSDPNLFTIKLAQAVRRLSTNIQIPGATTITGLAENTAYVRNESELFDPIVCRVSEGNPSLDAVRLEIQYDNGESRTVPTITGAINFPISGVRNESGRYRCIGANEANIGAQFPPVVLQFNITILYAPDFGTTSRTIVVDEGKPLRVTCRVASRPMLVTFDRIFNNITTTFLPQYQSEVQAQAATDPNAVHKVDIFNVQSATSAEAGVYTCSARNSIGQSDYNISVTVIRRPSAPRSLNATSNASYIELAFAPPLDNGGADISLYIIKCDLQSTGLESPHSVNFNTSQLTFNVTGLYAGETYQCTVSARNRAGVGAESAAASADLLPGPPCTPQLSQLSVDGTVVISALIPCSGGTVVTCNVARAPSDGFTGALRDCPVGTNFNFTDASAASGVDYTYILTVGNDAASVPSAGLSARVYVPTTLVSAVPTSSSVEPTSSSPTASATIATTVDDLETGASSGGLSGGAIGGIIVGALVVVAIVVILVVILVRKRAASSKGSSGAAAVSYKRTEASSGAPKDELHYANVDHTHKDGGKSATGSSKGGQSTNYAPIDFDKSGKKTADDNPVGAASTIV